MSLQWGETSQFAGPTLSPGFRFWTTYLQWQKGLNTALRSLGLTQPQFAILSVCAWLSKDDQQVNQQAIADFTGLDRMTISQVVSKLDDLGLVRRQSSPADARIKLLTITPQGVLCLTTAIPIVESYDAQFMAGCDVAVHKRALGGKAAKVK